MSELGDTFAAWKEAKKEKKERNLCNSIKLLVERGIAYEQLGPHHYRVGEYDFWPSTGKYVHRETKTYKRGVFGLIKAVLASDIESNKETK